MKNRYINIIEIRKKITEKKTKKRNDIFELRQVKIISINDYNNNNKTINSLLILPCLEDHRLKSEKYQ